MFTTLRVAARADAPAEAPPSVDLPYPVIDRATDMREALGALMADPGFVEAVERKRAIEGLAEPRWFDAAAVEDTPSAFDGSQLTERKIDEIVRNLAAEKTAVPIDGGGVSQVHETTWNTAAKAAGWVYAAAKSIDADGRAHLWLYGALLPEVDAAVESKSLQFGSIAWVDDAEHRYTGDPIGAVLQSYALTNTPFIDGLEPHASRAIRAAGRSLHVTPGPGSRDNSQESHMADQNGAEALTSTDLIRARAILYRAADQLRIEERGPAMDLLKQVADLLKVDAEDAEDWELSDKLWTLTQTAEVEEMLGGTPMAEAPAPEEERAEDPPAAAVTPEPQRMDGEEGANAEAFQAAALAAAQTVNAEITPEQVLAAIEANAEALFGAASEEEGAPAEDRDALRARANEADSLRKRVAELEKRNAEADDALFAREVVDYATEQLAEKADTLTDEDREVYVDTARAMRDAGKDWQATVRTMCGARQAPPSGTVMDEDGAQRRSFASSTEALAEARRELRTQHPDMREQEVRSRAYKLVRERNPELLTD